MTQKSINNAACISATKYVESCYRKQTLRGYEAIEYKKRLLFSGLQNSLISRPMQIRTDGEVKLVCDIIAALLYNNDGSIQQQQRLEQLEMELEAYDRKHDLDGDTRPSGLCEILREQYGILDFYEESFNMPYDYSFNFLYAFNYGKYFLPEKEICCSQGKPYKRNEEHIFTYEEETMPF